MDYPLDTSTFVRISIEEVLVTLAEAIGLVFLVMYLFLQNLRATLIPTIVRRSRSSARSPRCSRLDFPSTC